jgi:hypothetical protein
MEERMNKLLGQNRKGNALLCRFFGETDRPCVAIAKTTEQVMLAIAEFWTGDKTSDETMVAMRKIAINRSSTGNDSRNQCRNGH